MQTGLARLKRLPALALFAALVPGCNLLEGEPYTDDRFLAPPVPPDRPTLRYDAAPVLGMARVPVLITPTVLDANRSPITGCALKAGTTALPAGISIDGTTCVVSGTATTTQSATTYTVVATNAVGTADDASFTLQLDPTVCGPLVFPGGGDGSPGDPYRVAAGWQFNLIRLCFSSHFRQTADFDLGGSAAAFEPFPDPFDSSYDGDGHRISGLYYHAPPGNTDPVGLFPIVDPGVNISNLTLVDIDLQGNECVGAFAGCFDGILTNCHASGTLRVSDTGFPFIGGLVGNSAGSIIDSSSSVSIQVGGAAALQVIIGGLVGFQATGPITNSHFTGTVTVAASPGADIYYGGISGLAVDSTITDSSATASVTTGAATQFWLGGLFGNVNTITLQRSFATGSVTTATDLGYAGGLAGAITTASTIEDSYALGSIANSTAGGSYRSGGFVGLLDDTSTITRSYSAAASVTAVGNSLGFVGVVLTGGVVADSYYYEHGGVPTDTTTGLTGLTSISAIQSSASFPAFTFPGTWRMPSANPLSPNGYRSPVFAWQCGSNGIPCF